MMAHEQDDTRGGCQFSALLEHTPRSVQRPPYRLYDAVAVPLYRDPLLRLIGIRRIMQQMLAAGVGTRRNTEGFGGRFGVLRVRFAGGPPASRETPSIR